MSGNYDQQPSAGQQAHEQPQVVPGDVDQVSLVDVLGAAQLSPSHAAAIQDQCKAALHQFGPELECLPGHLGQQPGTVVVYRPVGGIISVSTQEAIAPKLGDAALPRTVVHRLQTSTGMVALVGDQPQAGAGSLRHQRPLPAHA
jgi:hypothetical protein